MKAEFRGPPSSTPPGAHAPKPPRPHRLGRLDRAHPPALAGCWVKCPSAPGGGGRLFLTVLCLTWALSNTWEVRNQLLQKGCPLCLHPHSSCRWLQTGRHFRLPFRGHPLTTQPATPEEVWQGRRACLRWALLRVRISHFPAPRLLIPSRVTS